ncbi:hypothetical protein FQN57_000545 [Myotisia sp. PD_48]|nr:hypothetical protein FQN57_000545 [Myotisia sp. PD_48]
MSKVWVITGCSSGFGREIALAAARRGDSVVATARNVSKIEDLKHLGLKIVTKRLDVLDDQATMDATMADVIKEFGRIDVLVNNVGYYQEGVIEELDMDEVKQSFDINVIGQLTVLRSVLPYMRAQRSGTIAHLGSVAGWAGNMTAGIYCGAKAAIALISESLHNELAPMGIDVTCIDPGFFRTNFLEPGHRIPAKNRIADYEQITGPMSAFFQQRSKNQDGDPVKGAELIVQVLTKSGVCAGRKIPPRLALGRDAVGVIGGALDKNRKILDDWAPIISTTDCDDVKA